jgi:hypothetical protein
MYGTSLAEKLTNTIQNVKIFSKQALEKRKTSFSLMEGFNIALKCRVFSFKELLNASIVRMCKS